MNPSRILFMLLVCSVSAIHADSHAIQVGRYTLATTEPTPAQADLLSLIIHIRFPKQLITVGEALEYVLLRSGYRLAEEVKESAELSILYHYPLPEVHRSLGPLSLRQAISTLVGTPYQIVEDPYKREITFKVSEPLLPMVSTVP
ncbi:MAG: pili assembly chaperone [Gammaproteobacteria bacterium]|nr:pili assembly chaperone [Gammaproteobacteria bacterium]